MSEAYAAAHIAQELGITVLADDVPKIVAAIHRAYAVGQRDGAAAEREACAQVCDDKAQDISLSNRRRCDADALATAIRQRGAA